MRAAACRPGHADGVRPRLTWKLGEVRGWPLARGNCRCGVYDLSDGGTNAGVVRARAAAVLNNGTASGWRYSTSVSAVFANRKLADTFYGVAPRYATATPRPTRPKAGWWWRLSANASRRSHPAAVQFLLAGNN